MDRWDLPQWIQDALCYIGFHDWFGGDGETVCANCDIEWSPFADWIVWLPMLVAVLALLWVIL